MKGPKLAWGLLFFGLAERSKAPAGLAWGIRRVSLASETLPNRQFAAREAGGAVRRGRMFVPPLQIRLTWQAPLLIVILVNRQLFIDVMLIFLRTDC